MNDILKRLSDKLDGSAGRLHVLEQYYNGEQPTSYLSPEAREALGDRLRTLCINFPRLAVHAVAERLEPTGFRINGGDAPDTSVWATWRRCRMIDGAAQAHVDALALGRSFVIVWAGRDGRPLITVESPHQVAVLRDPATREVTAALKRWVGDGKGHAVLYGPDTITRYTSAANVEDPAAMPATSWELAETISNPLGVVPVVPIVNRGRLLEVDGVSEMADLLDPADALNKIVADMMVTSEMYARPRRWASGLEIMEDEEGNPVKPFSVALDDVWQSEDPATKFGQFEATGLNGYGDAAALLTQQIGALSNLPPHYLGLNGDQPPSADAIRSAEASLVSRCLQIQRTFGDAWADVARLVVAVETGVDPAAVDVETVWASPETRTAAQAADAAAKLAGIGVPLPVVLEDQLGMTPAQVERVRAATRTQALDSAGVDLTGLVA